MDPIGSAEVLMGVDASMGGIMAPGVEQKVVVVSTTVVCVSTTVALGGQSLASEHKVVWTDVEVTRTTTVVVPSISRRAPV